MPHGPVGIGGVILCHHADQRTRDQADADRTALVQPSEKEMGLNDVMNTLFSRLDELEKKIKPLEEEYRNIKIAIDVIAKVRSVHG